MMKAGHVLSGTLLHKGEWVALGAFPLNIRRMRLQRMGDGTDNE